METWWHELSELIARSLARRWQARYKNRRAEREGTDPTCPVQLPGSDVDTDGTQKSALTETDTE
jgi:hypothetical protein